MEKKEEEEEEEFLPSSLTRAFRHLLSRTQLTDSTAVFVWRTFVSIKLWYFLTWASQAIIAKKHTSRGACTRVVAIVVEQEHHMHVQGHTLPSTLPALQLCVSMHDFLQQQQQQQRVDNGVSARECKELFVVWICSVPPPPEVTAAAHFVLWCGPGIDPASYAVAVAEDRAWCPPASSCVGLTLDRLCDALVLGNRHGHLSPADLTPAEKGAWKQLVDEHVNNQHIDKRRQDIDVVTSSLLQKQQLENYLRTLTRAVGGSSEPCRLVCLLPSSSLSPTTTTTTTDVGSKSRCSEKLLLHASAIRVRIHIWRPDLNLLASAQAHAQAPDDDAVQQQQAKSLTPMLVLWQYPDAAAAWVNSSFKQWVVVFCLQILSSDGLHPLPQFERLLALSCV